VAPSNVSPANHIEQLTVNRLPGEPLGMDCDVMDSDVIGPRVFVRKVVNGSPAERASGGNRGVEVGDEILSINGVKLSSVSSVGIIQLISETPLTVSLLIRRQVAGVERPDGQNLGDDNTVRPGYALQTCKPSVLHEGFEVRQVTFYKLATDKLALQLKRRTLGFQNYSQVTQLHFYQF